MQHFFQLVYKLTIFNLILCLSSSPVYEIIWIFDTIFYIMFWKLKNAVLNYSKQVQKPIKNLHKNYYLCNDKMNKELHFHQSQDNIEKPSQNLILLQFFLSDYSHCIVNFRTGFKPTVLNKFKTELVLNAQVLVLV